MQMMRPTSKHKLNVRTSKLENAYEFLKKLSKKSLIVSFFSIMFVFLAIPLTTVLAEPSENTVAINLGGSDQNVIDIIILLTVLSIIPSLVIMTTAFTRIVIVLSFLRSAIGTQQAPPNQVLIGMALVLTLFVMSPTLNEINEVAYKPYTEEKITQEECLEKAQVPLKRFMLKQTKNSDLKLFMEMSETTLEEGKDSTELPLLVIIPSFVTSELKRAFLIGFLLFIPFLIIDMIVASTLMSMGMMMLPPSMISLPFKLLLFVLVDGWGLLFSSLVGSFNL